MPRNFKTILCATDFSEASYHALDYGLRFAVNAGGTLIVAHIIHVPDGDIFGPAHETTGVHPIAGALSFDEAKKWVLDRLEELHAARLDHYPRCEFVVDVGDPAEQTLALARQRAVDLIVSATHGRSGLSHLIMGSVAEKVIRHAPCPVLVVRSGVD
jgi:universal stress protein A